MANAPAVYLLGNSLFPLECCLYEYSRMFDLADDVRPSVPANQPSGRTSMTTGFEVTHVRHAEVRRCLQIIYRELALGFRGYR